MASFSTENLLNWPQLLDTLWEDQPCPSVLKLWEFTNSVSVIAWTLSNRSRDSLPEQLDPQEVPEWHLEEIAKRRAQAEREHGRGKPWREVLNQPDNHPNKN